MDDLSTAIHLIYSRVSLFKAKQTLLRSQPSTCKTLNLLFFSHCSSSNVFKVYNYAWRERLWEYMEWWPENPVRVDLDQLQQLRMSLTPLMPIISLPSSQVLFFRFTCDIFQIVKAKTKQNHYQYFLTLCTHQSHPLMMEETVKLLRLS